MNSPYYVCRICKHGPTSSSSSASSRVHHASGGSASHSPGGIKEEPSFSPGGGFSPVGDGGGAIGGGLGSLTMAGASNGGGAVPGVGGAPDLKDPMDPESRGLVGMGRGKPFSVMSGKRRKPGLLNRLSRGGGAVAGPSGTVPGQPQFSWKGQSGTSTGSATSGGGLGHPGAAATGAGAPGAAAPGSSGDGPSSSSPATTSVAAAIASKKRGEDRKKGRIPKMRGMVALQVKTFF